MEQNTPKLWKAVKGEEYGRKLAEGSQKEGTQDLRKRGMLFAPRLMLLFIFAVKTKTKKHGADASVVSIPYGECKEAPSLALSTRRKASRQTLGSWGRGDLTPI